MSPIVRLYPIFLLASLTLSVHGALPELSSIEPLEFDEASQRLVAKGDARLDFEGTRLQADKITYYQEYGLADAQGNVKISRDGYRLLAERISFDAENNMFSAQALRTGQWPFYMNGIEAGGGEDNASIQDATFYYGNPSPFALSVESKNIQYLNGDSESVKLDGATFRIGNVPFFHLPGYTHYLNNAPYFLELGGGYNSELGLHLQTTTLFPVTSWLRAGANFDLYSERGALIGPTAQYSYDNETQKIVGAFSSGYIKDQGDTEEDIYNDSIDAERGYIEWRHKHNIGERVTLTASASYWSDSEITRDFKDDYYYDNQNPDTFVEGVYAGDNYFVSAFGRFRPNDFQVVEERLPELRFDLLPIPLFNTGIYHRASASYARLRQDYDRAAPLVEEITEIDRLDLSHRIERPFLLTDWLTLKPLAGARITHYANQEIAPQALGAFAAPFDPSPAPVNLTNDQFTRKVYELGFDLEARAYATYPTQNQTWGVDGLRHLVRPVLRYRYFSDPDSENEIAVIDRQAFDLNRPILDLSDIRSTDQINETHLARLGVENLYQTRSAEYGSRTLAALNFYQDILFEKAQRYDGDEQETFNASWVELVLTPAPWLKFDIATRFKTKSLTLEEIRTRTALISGEIWEIGLSTDFLRERIDQYSVDWIYRFNERFSLLADTRFDAESGDFTRTRLGFQTHVGSTWEILYALTFREEAQRESDVEFDIRVRLTNY